MKLTVIVCPMRTIETSWGKITLQFILSVYPAAEMTLFPWKLKYVKEDMGWLFLRWVGGFTSGKELQHSDEVNADCRSVRLNILLSSQLSVNQSLKMTLSSFLCPSPLSFSFYTTKCLFFSFFGVGFLLILITQGTLFSLQFNYCSFILYTLPALSKIKKSPALSLTFPYPPTQTHTHTHWLWNFILGVYLFPLNPHKNALFQ